MSDIQKIWSDTFHVHTYEVDALGRMSLPVLGSLLQEIASRHANHLGWGYDSLIKNNCIWVLTALKIQMERDPYWNDEITIHTWPSGKNRLYYFRDFKMQTEKGKHLGIATTNWLIIDIESRKPARLEIAEPFDYTELDSIFDERPRKWPNSEDLSLIDTVHVQFDDLDINNHVNNIRYFDWMLRSIKTSFRKTHRLHTFEIHFISEATDQDDIQVMLGQNDNEFQHLLIRKSNEKPIAQARSHWAPLNPQERESPIKNLFS